MIWKLKKTVYGLYDGSRAFYTAIDLIKMGGTRIIGEEALYAFHEGEGKDVKLTGLVGVHADSPVRPGVPNNGQFFNDFGLLIILSTCFFPGWFFKKS